MDYIKPPMDEETRKKKLRDWRDRYRSTFRSDDQFCNWLNMPWFYKPVTPKHLREYERQKALIEEFYLYKGVYDGLGSSHLYNGNKGKYWEIYYAEYEKALVVKREETAKFLAEIRGQKVTTGLQDKPIKKPKRNSNPNPIKRIEYRD